MAFYITGKASVRRLGSTSTTQSFVVINSRTSFLPKSKDFKVVFHSKLNAVTFRIFPDERYFVAETAWLNGLRRERSPTELAIVRVSGTGYDRDACYFPRRFPHLSLTHHLTISLQRLEFSFLVIGKALAPLLTKALPFFKAIRHISVASCYLDAPCGALINAVDISPSFSLGLSDCSCEQTLLQCRFERHHAAANTQQKGYFNVTQWSMNSIIQRTVNKQMVTLIEKCCGMKTSITMINRLPQLDASMLQLLKDRLNK